MPGGARPTLFAIALAAATPAVSAFAGAASVAASGAAAPSAAFLALDYPPIPPFWTWVILILFFGFPVLSFALLVVFGATTRFDVRSVRLKGESLRGIIASSAARMAIGEMDSLYLPLEVVVTKRGILPLAVHVKDVELDLFLEDRYISTVNETESFLIERASGEFRVPVHTHVALEGRLKEFLEVAKAVRDHNWELKVGLKGQIAVRHWLFTRTVPVKVTQHLLLRAGTPVVKDARWDRADESGWELSLQLQNPLRETRLEGDVDVALVRQRFLLPGREAERKTFHVALEAGETRTLIVRAETKAAPGERGLYPVVYFEGERVWPGILGTGSPKARGS